MDWKIRESFLEVSEGFSSDRVVADPEINSKYIAACRRRGLNEFDGILNTRLLNARKARHLSGIKTTRRTSFRGESEYRFAAEIAIRFLERRDTVTLDQVICSPTRVCEFDKIASRLCPGLIPLKYRWAALNLRKKRKLRPEIVSQLCPALDVTNLRVDDLHLEEVAAGPGVYIFFDSRATLYVGETESLRKRLSKHLEHSDNKGLAQWLWKHGVDQLHLEIQVLPTQTSIRARKALEAELIKSRSPVFNVKGK